MQNASGDHTKAWLSFSDRFLGEAANPRDAARLEIDCARERLGISAPVAFADAPSMGEGFSIEARPDRIVVCGGEAGLLYGAHRLIQQFAADGRARSVREQPAYPLRALNHWDNADGSVERGYAGRSLFFEAGRLDYDERRIHFYARLLASVGINAVAINNVNVEAPANQLIGDMLPDLARLARILRIHAVRLLVCVDYAAPLGMGLDTADPLDARVAAWWAERTREVYRAIPDLAGYLVKADSERRAGPHRYGRTQAEGANMLARALAPHGGTLVWRCFVYNCEQDWRNARIDRPKAAYETFQPLDGRFDENVILQVKNGPVDFQVREPLSPLLLGAPRTRKALEVQLTQEYTGHQIDLYFMQDVWREVFQDMPRERVCAVCAVANLGRDRNWAGHDLAMANLFAFGRMAWNPGNLSEDLALEWARLTFGREGAVPERVAEMLAASRAAYQKYASPLGLGWMVTPQTHYGPSPEGYEYTRWGTYIRADREAVGVDRSGKGTGFTAQYPPALRARYEDAQTCPDDLLLFFHRLPYGFLTRDGRPLIQRIYDDHFEGAQAAEALLEVWKGLEGSVEAEVFERVLDRLNRQVQNARQWRDVINTYFYRHSGIPDARGRPLYP